MIIIKAILVFLIILCIFPFAGIGFICGFLYRVLGQCFLIGYDCIANTYLKDLDKEIQEFNSLKFSEDKDNEENV